MTSDLSIVRALALAEYQALKAEQLARISTRDNLLYATLAVLAGVLTVTASLHSATALLLTPPALWVLGWVYLANDAKISEIGCYIRTGLAGQAGHDAFGWEHHHRSGHLRTAWKAGWLVVDLLMFTVPSLLAIGVFLSRSHNIPAALLAAAVLEIAGMVVFAYWTVITDSGHRAPAGTPAPAQIRTSERDKGKDEQG